MSGSVVGAVPFLGPLVAAWITLMVGVMAVYFLSVARHSRAPGVRDRQWREPPPAEQWPVPVPPRTGLPAYDMENYPDRQWGSPADPG